MQGTATAKVGPGAATYNPLLPAFRDDPHPFLHQLRRDDPVHWSPVFQVWVLTRYADSLAALRDERLSASARRWDNYGKFFYRGGAEAAPPPAEVYRHWMLQLDPPDHTRLRALVTKAFTPRVVEEMRGRVQAVVDELLDRLRGQDEMDVVADLAYPLPIRVIAELLGTPAEDYERIKRWSADLLPSFGPIMSARELEHVSRTMADFGEYFRGLVARRRRCPGQDLLDGLIAARDGANRLSDDELVATCILLVFAGHLSTVQLIANGMLSLLRHPEQLSRLRREPDLIGSAVEEMLRYESPLQVINRTAAEDTEIGGKTIRKNQMVLISLPAANRDPQQFPDPDCFDIGRGDNRHVAFGYGGHYCAGAPLARLEARIAIQTLLSRHPALELIGVPLEREPSLLLRGLKSLPIRFGLRQPGGSSC